MDSDSNDLKFKTVRFGGFDKESVLTYIKDLLEKTTTEKQRLNDEIKIMKADMKEKDEKIGKYSEFYQKYADSYTRITELMQQAEDKSAEIIHNAEQEADKLLNEARCTSDELKAKADAHIEQKANEYITSTKKHATTVCQAAEALISQLTETSLTMRHVSEECSSIRFNEATDPNTTAATSHTTEPPNDDE